MKRIVQTEHKQSPFRAKFTATLVVCLLFPTLSMAQGVNRFQTQEDDGLRLTAHFQLEQNTRKGYLVLKAQFPKRSYIYSLTQRGTPPPSKIEIATSDLFKTSGTFKPEKAPTVIENDPDFGGRVEKHKESLSFFIPLELAESASLEELSIKLRFNGQLCSEEGTCMPVRDKIVEARFSGYFQRVAEQGQSSRTVRR